MGKLLIINGKVHTMSEQGIIENGKVLIENGKIIDIGNDIQHEKNIKIIDAKGNYVLPGFIDAHTHIGIFEKGGESGVDGNEISDPITPQIRAIDGINYLDCEYRDAFCHGITSIATGPGSANPIAGQFVAMKTYGKTYKDMIIQEYNSMKMSFGENPKNVYGKSKKMPVTRMATSALIREWLCKASEYVYRQKQAEKEGSRFDKFDLKLEALAKVIRREVCVKAHAHRVDDILSAIRIADEFHIKMSIEHCTEGYLIPEEIAKSKRGVILGPMLTFPSKKETIASNPKSAGILGKAGIKFAIMTDLPATPTRYLPLVVGVCMKEGLSEVDAFRSITINAAEILGLDDRIGSLEKGKDADIIIYSGHPFIDVMSKCITTIINGEVVYSLK